MIISIHFLFVPHFLDFYSVLSSPCCLVMMISFCPSSDFLIGSKDLLSASNTLPLESFPPVVLCWVMSLINGCTEPSSLFICTVEEGSGISPLILFSWVESPLKGAEFSKENSFYAFLGKKPNKTVGQIIRVFVILFIFLNLGQLNQ